MDGNCFYHAIAQGVGRTSGRPLSSRDVRARTAAFYASVGEAGRAQTTLRDGTWADDRDVQATANALNIKICVWEGANAMWVHFEPRDSPVPPLPSQLHLENESNMHFNLLEPMSNEIVRQEVRSIDL